MYNKNSDGLYLTTVNKINIITRKETFTMIRVFSGGRYNSSHWLSLCEILEQGLHSICCNNCDICKYNFACREVSQAITYCAKNANVKLSVKDVIK